MTHLVLVHQNLIQTPHFPNLSTHVITDFVGYPGSEQSSYQEKSDIQKLQQELEMHRQWILKFENDIEFFTLRMNQMQTEHQQVRRDIDMMNRHQEQINRQLWVEIKKLQEK